MGPDHPPDDVLVEGILGRDACAFEALFDRYEALLQRHVVYIVHDEAGAQDVVQEAFLRVWDRADQWDGHGTFRAWLYRIATNLALNHLRTVKRRREVPLALPLEPEGVDDEPEPVPAWVVDSASLGPEAAMELVERRIACRRAVGRLSEDKRTVLRLVYEMEMSVSESAGVLDLPEGTVKSRLHYARRQLAREWRDIDPDV
jgi:RNA polymerase sigma-70 factor (ECF subfamily)